MGAFQLPWTVIGISMALAVIATYFAASRPAKAIAQAADRGRAGRPPARAEEDPPPGASRSASASWSARSSCSARPGPAAAATAEARPCCEVVLGFVALAVAIVLLAPACSSVVAAAGKRSPIAIRLALRDLARYRARSGPALAAISLSTLIAVIICVASAARFGNVLDYAGPNLTSSQLIVYAPCPGDCSGPNGRSRPAGEHGAGAEGREANRRRPRHDQHGHAGVDQRGPHPRGCPGAPGPARSTWPRRSCSRRSASARARSTRTPTSSRCGPACPR